MNHYHDHERQTRRMGLSDEEKAKRPFMLLRSLHKAVRKQAILLFQLHCHPEGEDAMERLKQLRPNKPAEQWEELRKRLYSIGVNVVPYHVLPEVTDPVVCFFPPMTPFKWRSLSPEGLSKLVKNQANKQSNAKSNTRQEST